MISLPLLTRRPGLALLLLILASRTCARPQATHDDLPSGTISAQIAKRTGYQDGNIHLSGGVIAAIVLGVLGIIALSTVLCCPCWKWTQCNKTVRAKRRPGPVPQPELNGRHYHGGGINELEPHEAVMRSELHEQDMPPRYEEIGTRANVRGSPELDAKVPMARLTRQMSGSGMEQEIGSVLRPSEIMSGTKNIEALPQAHVRK